MATKYVLMIGDGRFVSHYRGERRYVSEYPEAQLFNARDAKRILHAVRQTGIDCRAVSEAEYERSGEHA